MNTTSQPNPASQAFDIHAKLRAANSHWSYCHAVQPHDKGFDYQFNTTFVGGMEFAVYERVDNHFVLVDFFKSYEEACDEAKNILDIYPDVRDLILQATSIL
ncbi:Uncharacterised protein [Klebsiella pneumoniae]|uniref:hypothetical protein n=1 Tax=Klebsiella pneumoniae TaxID=573 RepID=UPI000B9E613A|nr:hypothetical protein [Klebsiella pneumoniae]MBW5571351.1 hypothetical protein [Klebsiella pneumoniae]MDZ1511317.1 hypothetical protein [Klebsiella pneumoniae]SVO79970.1 Uncharacterised protein [Klebsiella pneumoniae]HBS1342947.1 hypothetical protein [Klebsiella pneumoniae]HBY7036889.1 hypothetical protein [Klebsiella pneumoniae]